MSNGPKVLIASNTPRWFERAKSSLPENCTVLVRHDFSEVIATVDENPDIALCIIANRIQERDEGIRIANELNNPSDPPIILFTREIDDIGRRQAADLGVVVIDMDDTAGLSHAVQTLLKQ